MPPRVMACAVPGRLEFSGRVHYVDFRLDKRKLRRSEVAGVLDFHSIVAGRVSNPCEPWFTQAKPAPLYCPC